MNTKRKAIISLIVVLALAVVSVLVLKIPTNEEGVDSSELTERITETPLASGTLRKIEYVNDEGRVVFAQDKWFAICAKELDADGRVVREFYYDADGAPTAMYAGYCGLAREYDAQGRNFKYTYLDDKREPMMASVGYASVLRNFDQEGRLSEEWYYDLEMHQVQASSGVYGARYKMDGEGRTAEVAYLDKEGRVVSCNSGYAIVRYTRDAEGKVDSYMYYDAEGEPQCLEKGQYGVRYTDSGVVFLGKDGQEIFSLNAFLSAHHWIVFLVGALLTLGVVIVSLRHRWCATLFVVVYGLFILYETLYRNTAASGVMRIHWFESFIHSFTESNARVQLVDNVWLFVPLGSGLFALTARVRLSVVVTFFASLAIEVIQLVTLLGYCEIDDVICNSLGGAMGVVFAWALLQLLGGPNRLNHIQQKTCKKI